MFTGIVEEIGKILSATPETLIIEAQRVLEGTALGESIAINGTCLSVTRIEASSFAVDVVPETLRRTNLGELKAGAFVNLERSLSFGGRVGGHLMQGHIDGTGRIVDITDDGDAILVRFSAEPSLLRYVVEKGFIAVDGVSLTVVGCGDGWFSVTLIPITRAGTVLGSKAVGDAVNLEADILAKYVERLLAGAEKGSPEGRSSGACPS